MKRKIGSFGIWKLRLIQWNERNCTKLRIDFVGTTNVHNNLQFYTKIVFWLSFRRANNEKNAAKVQHQESISLCGYSMELFGNSQKYLCSLRYNILISFFRSFFMHNGLEHLFIAAIYYLDAAFLSLRSTFWLKWFDDCLVS